MGLACGRYASGRYAGVNGDRYGGGGRDMGGGGVLALCTYGGIYAQDRGGGFFAGYIWRIL